MNSDQRRHVISPDGPLVCWCGSCHSWTLAKVGWCDCTKKNCTEVHKK